MSLEEACEVIDAIDGGDRKALCEELGDLLLQVVFQAELARREGAFAIDDVVAGIVDKLVTRHPHVFGHLDAKTADEVLRNWERQKAKEKKRPRHPRRRPPEHAGADARAARRGEGRPRRLRLGRRARVSRQGRRGARRARPRHRRRKTRRTIEEEMGDVLFALVNLSRHVEVDAEGALRRTIDKFTRRFAHVEKRVARGARGLGRTGRPRAPAPARGAGSLLGRGQTGEAGEAVTRVARRRTKPYLPRHRAREDDSAARALARGVVGRARAPRRPRASTPDRFSGGYRPAASPIRRG